MNNMVELKDSGSRINFSLDRENPEVGMHTAIFNGQVRLALDYAELVIANLRSDIAQLQQRIVAIENKLSEAPAEKVTSAAAPARRGKKVEDATTDESGD